jgi:hypothetical protein
MLRWSMLACWASPDASSLGDAERMVRALDPELPLEEVLAGCRESSDPDGRGDCLSAAVTSHRNGRLSDCQDIGTARWRSECIFRLAERSRKQNLAQAVALCGDSDFDRECWGHLIRDEALDQVAQTPREQADQVATLAALIGRADSEELYWEEWALGRYRADLMVRREDCGGLEPPGACVRGLRRARMRLEAELGTENRCQAFQEERPELALSDGRTVLNSAMPRGADIAALCGSVE